MTHIATTEEGTLTQFRTHPRIIFASTSMVRLAAVIAALMIAGTACGASDSIPSRRAGPGDPSLSIPSRTPDRSATLIPEPDPVDNYWLPGETVVEISSPDGKWRASATAMPNETLSMTVVGPSYDKTYDIARPIAFSPDSAFLVYDATPTGFVAALHVLALHPPFESLQITNLGLRWIGRPPDPTYIPSPTDPSIVQWGGSRLRYSEPEGTYELDVNSMMVIRVGP